jgi:nucleotide-binding universal stress UspA family protein
MAKLKILVPLDGSEKSLDSLNWLKKYYKKEDTDVTLLYVAQVVYTSSLENININPEHPVSYNNGELILNNASKLLDGYVVNEAIIHGAIADTILDVAANDSFDLIIMTKSSVKGFSRIFGSVTTKVVRDSEVAVIVIP